MIARLLAGPNYEATWQGILIVIVSLTAAIAYLPLVEARYSPLRAAMKTLPVAALTLLPLTCLSKAPVALALLAAALGLSALGDLLLAMKDQSRYFVRGLVAFLTAHVAYIAVFLPHAAMPDAATLAAIGAALLAASALMVWLWPSLGKMRMPVFAYFAVIMAMVAAAFAVPAAPWTLAVGAVTFAVSDSLIAVRKFAQPFPLIGIAVWITYIAAQFMIVHGVLTLLLAQ